MEYKIGLLIAQSNTYSSSQDFFWGFKEGLKKVPDFPVKIFVENIGFGQKTAIQQQYEKMALQNAPDIIVGMAQWRSLVGNEKVLNQYRIPALFCDIGANLPLPQPLGEHIYFNSFNLWQSNFAMGKYLAKQGHKKVLYLSHFYDGGYHTPYAFCSGVSMGRGDYVMPFAIQDGYNEQEFERLKMHIEQTKPDAIHALYSNPRHYVLLDWLKNNPQTKDISLTANPYWVDDDLLLRNPNEHTIGILSANSWSRLSPNPINQAIVSQFEEEEEETCSVFVMMGYEAGALLAKAYEALGDKWSKRKYFKSFLLDAKLDGPRDGHHFNSEYQCSFANHHLRKVEKTEGGLQNKVIRDLNIDESLTILKPLYEKPNSGWDNLYLCV
ncbi:MAG: ABC transporter substrate-binding protein [Chitinophagales bacterium]